MLFLSSPTLCTSHGCVGFDWYDIKLNFKLCSSEKLTVVISFVDKPLEKTSAKFNLSKVAKLGRKQPAGGRKLSDKIRRRIRLKMSTQGKKNSNACPVLEAKMHMLCYLYSQILRFEQTD